MDINLQDIDNAALYILFLCSALLRHRLPLPVSYLLPILLTHIHLKCQIKVIIPMVYEFKKRHLQSCGCFVVEKHPSADMYSSSAPPTGSSLKPLDRNTINWLSVGLYSRYLCGLSRMCRLSPFSK